MIYLNLGKNQIQYVNNFAEDGIIDFDRWVKSRIKVLFVLKETNDFCGNLCKCFLDKFQKSKKPKIWFTSALWNYAAINTTANGFPSLTAAMDNAREAFSDVAVMNLKKCPGGSNSNMPEIKKH